MTPLARFEQLRGTILALPYARMLGFDVSCDEAGVGGHLPFAAHLIGNPLVPALHGGVIAALLNFTAVGQLMLAQDSAAMPRILTCTIEYLASPALRDCSAVARITSQSRRFATLRAEAMQPHSGRMIAAASLQFLCDPPRRDV
jgi:acyl-coenzyme A thioesterase PaaI-like protein